MSAPVSSDPRTSHLAFMHRRLTALQTRQLYRQSRAVSNGAQPWVDVDGRRLLNLSSNNYLGLATHPVVIAATAHAAEQGAAGSSRLLAGTSDLHQSLEIRLAAFKGTQRALLFNSGYSANVGIIPALVGPGDIVLGDELNHASLIDGCRLSRAEYGTYRHGDSIDLAARILSAKESHPRGRLLVVTDSVFSMDGDVAPLKEIAALCRMHGAMLLVDEAHGTGCVGPGGRGLVAELGLERDVTIVMGTLSKALGSFGAFAAADDLVIEYLVNVARSFIFSTALPVSVVAASYAALDVLHQETWRIDHLQRNAEIFRHGLQHLGFDTRESVTHIVPVLVGESARALEMAAGLRQEDVFAVAVRPPTVPPGTARIRASVMATHTPDDLAFALDAFERVGRCLGVID